MDNFRSIGDIRVQHDRLPDIVSDCKPSSVRVERESRAVRLDLADLLAGTN
jgi:hypothetical protein